ncbi:Hypothetical predicted protein [Octopus vulgaris]|uniref:Uncharacterized protein n=1 Tax=Octopus vulgaris TaxID=6645 RepID=A0AA36EXR2_OCTVU|nr:Hypothetical predicted protein [Octopus vulgaris]
MRKKNIGIKDQICKYSLSPSVNSSNVCQRRMLVSGSSAISRTTFRSTRVKRDKKQRMLWHCRQECWNFEGNISMRKKEEKREEEGKQWQKQNRIEKTRHVISTCISQEFSYSVRITGFILEFRI